MCVAGTGGAFATVGECGRSTKDPSRELPEAQAAQQSEEAMTPQHLLLVLRSGLPLTDAFVTMAIASMICERTVYLACLPG